MFPERNGCSLFVLLAVSVIMDGQCHESGRICETILHQTIARLTINICLMCMATLSLHTYLHWNPKSQDIGHPGLFHPQN